MRIIFSRKGFDSASGGCPSPIIDGRPTSLPIPTRMPSPVTFASIAGGLATLVSDLTSGRYNGSDSCHLDPDIDEAALLRRPGWRGALGQVGHAQRHLANQRVGPGDLFLFWGLFRPVRRAQRWQFFGTPEHRIFGWLQVAEVLSVGSQGAAVARAIPWLADHPHARNGWPETNTIYTATERLELRDQANGFPGWGCFSRGWRLTAPASQAVSTWSIPTWLNSAFGGAGMTYHRESERWNKDGTVSIVGRGQEFVADAGDRSDVLDWLARLFANAT